MLSSAVASFISADDLISVAAIYLLLSLAFSALFHVIHRRTLDFPERRGT